MMFLPGVCGLIKQYITNTYLPATETVSISFHNMQSVGNCKDGKECRASSYE